MAIKLACLLLEKLPAELRNLIYEEALQMSDPVTIISYRSTAAGKDSKEDHGHVLKPALPSVCKQIRQEATPVFLCINTFHASMPDQKDDSTCLLPFSWFGSLNATEKKAINKLQLQHTFSRKTINTYTRYLFDFRHASYAASGPSAAGILNTAAHRFENRINVLFKNNPTRLICHELLLMHQEGFDLKKLVIKATSESGDFWQVVSKAWQRDTERAIASILDGTYVDHASASNELRLTA